MITLTESAARHVRDMLAKRSGAVGLRIGVRHGGCAGLAYQLDFADAEHAGDVRFESRGVTILVGRENLAYLDGVELDYRREGLNEAFKFNNPNVKEQCGCGESFRT